jgi:hypothetical protein
VRSRKELLPVSAQRGCLAWQVSHRSDTGGDPDTPRCAVRGGATAPGRAATASVSGLRGRSSGAWRNRGRGLAGRGLGFDHRARGQDDLAAGPRCLGACGRLAADAGRRTNAIRACDTRSSGSDGPGTACARHGSLRHRTRAAPRRPRSPAPAPTRPRHQLPPIAPERAHPAHRRRAPAHGRHGPQVRAGPLPKNW